MKLNYFTAVSLFFNIIPQHPHACLILAQFLQLSWQKLGSFILIVVEFVTTQVLYYWSKNISSVGTVSTICWIFLKFQVALLQQLIVFVIYSMGLHYCALGSDLMMNVHVFMFF